LRLGEAADRPAFGYDSTHGGTEGIFYFLVRDDLILINNRQQNSRRRGRSNNNQRPQGGNSGGNRNQDNGNRIDNRSRGNAAQLLEKYKTLARDAQQSGDRVLTEYYLQFSDHYFRVLADTRARYEENQPRREGGQDQGDAPQSYDDNEEPFDGDEFDPRPQSRVQAPQAQPRYDREPQQQEARDDGDRDNRPRRDYGDRPRNNGNGNGQDRAPRDDYRQERQLQQDRPREDRPRAERPVREDRPREDRPREDRPAREERPRRDREPRVARDEAPEESTLSLDLLPPAIAVAPLVNTEEPVAPKRRGRPKKVVDEATVEG
jgi:hypothetical protein